LLFADLLRTVFTRLSFETETMPEKRIRQIQAQHCLRVWIVVFGLLLAGIAYGQTSPVFATDGVALRGYDPVAYFDGAPALGSDAFSHEWNGVVWKFASARNRARFIADPERHSPRFGGFCALGMAHGGAVPTDPNAFTIHRGKLYLNATGAVRETWAYDPDWMIERAEPRWRTIRDSPPNRGQRPPLQAQADAGAANAPPLALAGFDPVSYFDASTPVRGREAITLVHNDRTWRFASKHHRTLFRKQPGKYAPQYAGFSALIVAHGGLVPADPMQYTIVDGRLFLELAPGPLETWRRNAPRLIERADKQWLALAPGREH
jgi:YHS domain-containing protein